MTFVQLVLAQSICVQDDFEEFKSNIDANCRNLVISNITFIHNGFRYQTFGETPELDSFANYVSRNTAIYEVNFETRDKSWTVEQKAEIEQVICNYVIKKDSISSNRIFPKGYPKQSYEHLLPKNVKSAFFMMMLGQEEEK